MPLFSKRKGNAAPTKRGSSIRVTPVRGRVDNAKPDFEDVYGEFFPRVMRFICSKTGDLPLSEDLAQEVMAACYRNYEKYDSARASLATWVFVIARNRLKNYYRSRRVDESIEAKDGFDLPSGEELIEEAVAFEETRTLLKEELANLSERERAVIEGKFFQGKTSEELAAELGMTAVNVRTVQSRARDKLKSALLARGYVR